MSELEKQFDAFNLTANLAKQLKELASTAWNPVEGSKRVVVETVVVKDGSRRVIKSEVTHAKLV